jgi:hypothetical protein
MARPGRPRAEKNLIFFITSTKYIGMDVHKESISIAVMNLRRQGGDGMRHQNESQCNSAVFKGLAIYTSRLRKAQQRGRN